MPELVLHILLSIIIAGVVAIFITLEFGNAISLAVLRRLNNRLINKLPDELKHAEDMPISSRRDWKKFNKYYLLSQNALLLGRTIPERTRQKFTDLLNKYDCKEIYDFSIDGTQRNNCKPYFKYKKIEKEIHYFISLAKTSSQVAEDGIGFMSPQRWSRLVLESVGEGTVRLDITKDPTKRTIFTKEDAVFFAPIVGGQIYEAHANKCPASRNYKIYARRLTEIIGEFAPYDRCYSLKNFESWIQLCRHTVSGPGFNHTHSSGFRFTEGEISRARCGFVREVFIFNNHDQEREYRFRTERFEDAYKNKDPRPTPEKGSTNKTKQKKK